VEVSVWWCRRRWLDGGLGGGSGDDSLLLKLDSLLDFVRLFLDK
jgi:hypothetical protein